MCEPRCCSRIAKATKTRLSQYEHVICPALRLPYVATVASLLNRRSLVGPLERDGLLHASARGKPSTPYASLRRRSPEIINLFVPTEWQKGIVLVSNHRRLRCTSCSSSHASRFHMVQLLAAS